MDPEASLPCSKQPAIMPPSSARWIQSIPPHPSSLISILILSSCLCLSLPSGLFPSAFCTQTLHAFIFSPTHIMHTLSSHRPQFWHRYNMVHWTCTPHFIQILYITKHKNFVPLKFLLTNLLFVQSVSTASAGIHSNCHLVHPE